MENAEKLASMFRRFMIFCWVLAGTWTVMLVIGTVYSGEIPLDGIAVLGFTLAFIGALYLIRWILFGNKKKL